MGRSTHAGCVLIHCVPGIIFLFSFLEMVLLPAMRGMRVIAKGGIIHYF